MRRRKKSFPDKKDILLKKVKQFPHLPGVYIMKKSSGEVLYVGKASSLRKRVESYFHKSITALSKEPLMQLIEDIEYIVCDSEAKALLLESSLIKEKKPKYNVDLKDGKSFPLVELSREDFPCVRVSRKRKDGFEYFGPFPQAKLVKDALELIRKIIPFRTCVTMPKKACLYFHISLCSGPCIKKISKAEYGRTMRILKLVLKGKRRKVLDGLRKNMHEASLRLQFEKASFYRDKLTALSSLYGVKKEFGELLALQSALRLKRLPGSIEAIDISNIRTLNATGSVVVFKDGVPCKSEYRRYKIKKRSRDDLSMIQEVVERRIKRIRKEKRKLSDLMIIDGGLAHANVAQYVLDINKVHIPVVAISKKHEEIWFPGKSVSLKISIGSPALRIIQRLRNEAHRFAHKYHLYLRNKTTYNK